MTLGWVCLLASLLHLKAYFHTYNACENTQTRCQWGQWKSEIFRWGLVQKHIMFSWKGSKREGACLRSHHLTSVGSRGDLLTVVVFPVQNMLTWENKVRTLKLKPLRLEGLLNKILPNSCALVCCIYLHFRRFALCGAHQWALMRIGSECIPGEGLKIPEPDIIFISSMVDYMACCSLTAALISGRYGRIYWDQYHVLFLSCLWKLKSQEETNAGFVRSVSLCVLFPHLLVIQ